MTSSIARSPTGSSARLRWITLFVLTALNILNYIDRNIFAALVPIMKADLHFSDAAFGWLGSAFILSYTLIAPLFGYIGDRGNRTRTMSAGLLLWSGATAFTGLTSSYIGQFFTRITVGFGEAAYSVISPTVISDYFPKSVRGKTFAIYSCAIPVGSALGYVLGGALEPIFGWRHTFFVVGVPGVLLTLLLFFLPNPPRGAQDTDIPVEAAGSWRESYKKLFTNGGFMFTVLGYAAYTFVVGGLSFWMPSYIVRYFDGITLSHGNYVFGLVTVAGGFIGTVVGGLLADYWERKHGNGNMKVAVLSMVLSIPLFVYVLTLRDFSRFTQTLFVLDIVLFMCISPMDAAVVNSVRPSLRATSMALNIFLIHALGDGISRGLMGQISDSSGLAAAMGMMPYMLGLAGVLWFCGMVFYFQPMAWPSGALAVPQWQAHRGLRVSAGVIENTLDAFRRARAAGAEMCECDVQITRDGKVVVFHDADLVRLGGGSTDLLKNLSAEEMRARVNAPLLSELLSDPACPRLVNIELKTSEARGVSGLERAVVDVIRACGASDRVLFSSFNPLALRRVAQLAPEIPRGLLVTLEDSPKNKFYLKKMMMGFLARPQLLHLDQNMISATKMDKWTDRHIHVAAWTVNDPARAQELLDQGVMSLITDNLYAAKS